MLIQWLDSILDDDVLVARLNTSIGDRDEWNKWGRLFAAAPDLLAVCELILARLDLEARDQGEGASFICSAYRPELRAAVAKATGTL